jgi:hypothetical protein
MKIYVIPVLAVFLLSIYPNQAAVQPEGLEVPVSTIGRGGRPVDAETLGRIRKAAEKGHSTAQHQLGTMYRSGDGVSHDSKAIKILFTVFVAVLVPKHWMDYGPTNFL